MQVPALERAEWLNGLNPYQKKGIETLLSLHDEEEAARIWVEANGLDDTQVFGGEASNESLWESVKTNFNKFVCGDPEYDDARTAVELLGGASTQNWIAAVSAPIALKIGVAVSVISPAITVLLFLVGKKGLKIWCGFVNRPPSS